MATSADVPGRLGPEMEITADLPVRPSSAEVLKLGNRRSADQVRQIVEALGGPDVVGVVGQVADDRGKLVDTELDVSDYGRMVYMFGKGRILIRDADLERVQRVVDGRVQEGGINGLTVVHVPGRSTLDMLRAIDQAYGVAVAYPDHVVHVTNYSGSACPAVEPWPPVTPKRWPVRDAHPDCSGAGAFVALVDTGFDPKLAADTPWLAGVQGDEEFYDPDDLGPYAGHGTFAAGVVRTMAPDAQAYVHGFLPHGGAGFESDVIVDGFAAALRDAPDVVSISAGTYTRGDTGMLGFRVAWEQFGTKGTIVVAAAGNDGQRKPFYPAADSFAIGVGALDPDGSRAAYSNYGSWVDCYALGSEHVNAFPRGTYVYRQAPMVGHWASLPDGLAVWSGTSFATPLVAGVIAARMTWSGENGQSAARAVLELARANAKPGIGAVVDPSMACRPERC